MGLFLGATELSTGGGGGGGFTKMNKYSTLRALADATFRFGGTFNSNFRVYSARSAGATEMAVYTATPADSIFQILPTGTQSVPPTFVYNSTTHSITSATANAGGVRSITFTPALTASIAAATYLGVSNPSSLNVNPATDLGLADGGSLGFFMVSSGSTSTSTAQGARGGRIIQGTRIISTASTNLVLTPGITGANSTISGGLALTTSDGSDHAGFNSYYTSSFAQPVGQGINGYGLGSVSKTYGSTMGMTSPRHGFGTGVGASTPVASDGAILLFY